MQPSQVEPSARGSFPRPIPLPAIDPDQGDQVCVQFSAAWLPAVLGSLLQLLEEATYNTSDPLLLQQAQDRANSLIYLFQSGVPCNAPAPIIEPVDEDMTTLCENLRFNQATGLFEGLCCGVWTPISGQPAGGFFNSGPTIGQPLPAAGGGCQSYFLHLSASEQTIVPPVVNTGDVITVSNISGSWSDGTAFWYTPDGYNFFAGIHAGVAANNGADPVPTQPHMGLLVKIAGVFHYIGNGTPYTVPGGVVNALAIFQANDSSLTDDSGTVAFQVQVCNNQPGAWSHTFDFTTGPHGWANGGAGQGLWVAGVGWQSQTSGANELLNITSSTIAATTVNSMEVVGSNGNAANGGTKAAGTNVVAAFTGRVTVPTAAGAYDVPAAFSAAGVTSLRVESDTSNNGHTPNVISKVVASGVGAIDPFAGM